MKPYLAPLGLLLLLALTVFSMEPPASRPIDAPEEAFSAERAMVPIKDLARVPHPPGTDEHARIRTKLVKRFSGLGLKTHVQSVRVVKETATEVRFVEAKNVVARLAGRESGPGLMLAAHYDSTPTGPGAGDDMAGVATLLETARALSREKPRHDVLFLITDAEEFGLLGAEGFVQSAPEAKEFPLVLNFEARGGSGPVFMFETGKNNQPLIEALARTPRPLATSLMYALYKTLPNDTDLSVFKRAGKSGLNFAFAESWPHYHTALDTAERLDRRSVQHHGEYALALARQLSSVEMRGAGDSIYFDLFSRFLVRYPEGFAWPLTALGLIAYTGALFLSARREKRTFWKGWGLGVGLGLLMLLQGSAAAVAIGFALGPLQADAPWRDPYGARWLEAALFFLALGAALAPALAALKRGDARAIALGALLWWAGLLVLATLFLPGASYLFLWPLLFTVLGQLPRRNPWLVAIAAAPTLVLLAPVWHGLALLLGFSMPPLLGGLVGLGLVPLLPAFSKMKPRSLWFLAAIGAACGLVGWLAFPPGSRYPRALSLTAELPARDAPKLAPVPGGWRVLAAKEGFEVRAATKVPIRAATLDGRALPLVQGKLNVRFLAPPQEGFTLALDAPPGTEVFWEEHVAGLTAPLPPESMVAPGMPGSGRVRHTRKTKAPGPKI